MEATPEELWRAEGVGDGDGCKERLRSPRGSGLRFHRKWHWPAPSAGQALEHSQTTSRCFSIPQKALDFRMRRFVFALVKQ